MIVVGLQVTQHIHMNNIDTCDTCVQEHVFTNTLCNYVYICTQVYIPEKDYNTYSFPHKSHVVHLLLGCDYYWPVRYIFGPSHNLYRNILPLNPLPPSPSLLPPPLPSPFYILVPPRHLFLVFSPRLPPISVPHTLPPICLLTLLPLFPPISLPPPLSSSLTSSYRCFFRNQVKCCVC